MTTSVVCEGDRDSPTVLVLDPAPQTDHGELPRAWRELSERRRIVWCRLAAAEALAEADRLLADPDALGRPIDVVTGPGADERVQALLNRHAGPVRALLLVDPARQDWVGEAALGITVRTVGSAGKAGRTARPLHRADVRTDVESAIAELDADSALPAPDKAQGGA
ncbi:hypothetical protein SacmaDRAFT_3210 [Saccharomonospora marina XMU15]|uniref:Uncharacterized protein n=1 Tax=Saccharomonospora marina XMU15 TaxID=882083 RepID=H5X8R6_9PSEU|nr:hypothetical protein [Saccharomonospora marina]EHR51435.1 hypothetical protein SacmaDRAFT_3210 [Saccharomonospora marina XMU15]